MVHRLLSVLLILWRGTIMADYKIQKIFCHSYDDYQNTASFQSDAQRKAARAILHCKSGTLVERFLCPCAKFLMPNIIT